MTADVLSRRERIDRSRSRAWALEILYRWESEGADRDLDNVFIDVARTRNVANRRHPHIRRILKAVQEHREHIDDNLTAVTRNWRLDRLSQIDRSTLRIGAAEILYLDDVPAPVAIQESVRLASRYGGNESAGFVNGVLDALYHRNRGSGGSTE